ncbi:MAG: tetratricopeptide repeat protein, partial [Elusimicrobia bacterium]|nr:tetratricopeptide repeat protein [Elusimicrobiota bacterium]
LAVILAAQGRYAEAIEHYREAVRLAPGYAPAYRNWAGLMASLGRRDAAAKLFEAVVKLDPTDAQARAAVKALSQGKEKR